MIDLVVQKTPPAGLRPALRASLTAVMQHFKMEDKEVTVALVSDKAIRALKLQHWDEDAPTDVLSFPTWEQGDPFMPPHLGDIIISLDTAQRQAQTRGHSLSYEVALLASHGMAHLVGHDHPHADGLGFEEGATGPDWQVFHEAWAVAKAALAEFAQSVQVPSTQPK